MWEAISLSCSQAAREIGRASVREMIEVELKADVRVAHHAEVHMESPPAQEAFGPVTLQIDRPQEWAVLSFNVGVNSQIAYDKRGAPLPVTGLVPSDYPAVCKVGQVISVVARYLGTDRRGGFFSAVARGPRA